MESTNLWSRRSKYASLRFSPSAAIADSIANSSKSSTYQKAEIHTRQSGSKRYVSGDHSSKANGLPSLTTNNAVTSPVASSAFGLGSGAFAAFGSAARTPKTGSASDFGKASPLSRSPPEEDERHTKTSSKNLSRPISKEQIGAATDPKSCPLKCIWVMWYRPPTQSKGQDYEKSIKPVYKMTTVQDFWKIYAHLKRPSALSVVSDYHLFKDSIRPVWEDEANKRGGKWIMRFKKGVMDRYWEELLLAIMGDQFAEAGDEVCGMVVSVRNGEDVLSVWTKNDGGKNVRIRETIKNVLNLPADTVIMFKSHDDSIAQKSAVEEARKDKAPTDKRRSTLGGDVGGSKDKSTASS